MSNLSVKKRIEREELYTKGLNSYWIKKLLVYKIIKSTRKSFYYILNEDAFNKIINKEFDNDMLDSDIARLEFKASISHFYEKALKMRQKGIEENKNASNIKANKSFNSAIDHLNKYIALIQEKTDKRTFSGYYELAKTYLYMNDWKNAEEKLLIALDIATEKGKKDIKAKVLFHLADMHFKCREYEKALYYYNKCYRLFDGKNTYESKNVMLQIITCDLFANRYNRDTLINYKDISELVTNNRIDEALNDLKSGNDIKCIHTLIAIAEHLYKDKKINAANTVLKQAQTLAKKYKDKNCNIEISELQKQSKIYKILR